MIDDSWYLRDEGLVEVISAGGAVVRMEGETPVVALITELDHPHFVLPKGHVEPGETVEAAARREIGEEAGLHELRLVRPLGRTERQNYERTKWKTIHYFLYTTDETSFHPLEGDKHPDAGWFPLGALPALFWPDQRRLLGALRAEFGARGVNILKETQ